MASTRAAFSVFMDEEKQNDISKVRKFSQNTSNTHNQLSTKKRNALSENKENFDPSKGKFFIENQVNKPKTISNQPKKIYSKPFPLSDLTEAYTPPSKSLKSLPVAPLNSSRIVLEDKTSRILVFGDKLKKSSNAKLSTNNKSTMTAKSTETLWRSIARS